MHGRDAPEVTVLNTAPVVSSVTLDLLDPRVTESVTDEPGRDDVDGTTSLTAELSRLNFDARASPPSAAAYARRNHSARPTACWERRATPLPLAGSNCQRDMAIRLPSRTSKSTGS